MISRLRLRLTNFSASSSSLRRHRRSFYSTDAVAISSSFNDSHPLKLNSPLFLRPLSHSTSPSALLSFRLWAESLARSSDLTVDGGPSASHLIRELSWLLQDATFQDGEAFLLRTDLEDLYRLWKQRIEERKPFQYLVGCEHWRDLVLSVGEGVLIPRPETEELVNLVSKVDGFEEGTWADLGTGSGAIAIGIAKLLGENGKVVATDLSTTAVEVAQLNIGRYKLEDKVEIRQGSWFEPLQDFHGKFSGLVSNPPYIPSSHIPSLQAEVGRHEPVLALDGGKDGMDHLICLCEGSISALKPGGFFAFETNGDEQSEDLLHLMTKQWSHAFHDITIVPDFAGIKRFVTGFRR